MRKADVIIIGCGPGGMDAASAAFAAGLDTVVIERAEAGGTCLNRGCIPTKSLCHWADVLRIAPGALTWGDALRRKSEVVETLRERVAGSMQSGGTYITGEARFTADGCVEVNGETFSAPKIIIATGSAPARLNVPGAELCIDSDRLLSLDKLPHSIAIIGGGVIGVEFACVLNAFGVKVTVLEYCKELLPNFDKDISKRLKTAMSRSGINVVTSATVTGIREGMYVDYELKGKPCEVQAEAVLMAVGRRPVLPEGIEALGIKVERGAIVVDDNFMTSVDGVYAVGDVNARLMLAHAASSQASRVMGHKVNLDVVPAAAFTHPECAMVGLTEEQCKASGMDIAVSKSLFRSNGKAMSMEADDGIVKLIIDRNTRKLVGAHICGPHAADLIQEPALAMSAGLTIDAIAETIHAHPTLGEVVHAAAAALS